MQPTAIKRGKKRKPPPIPLLGDWSLFPKVYELPMLPVGGRVESSRMEKRHLTMTNIIPNLYLGSACDANDVEVLSKTGIKHVLTLSIDDLVGERLPGITYHRVAIEDRPDADIDSTFSSTYTIIDTCLKLSESILVHCSRGISRSPTIVAAYLLKNGNQTSVNECLSELERKRPQILPNLGFELWLKRIFP